MSSTHSIRPLSCLIMALLISSCASTRMLTPEAFPINTAFENGAYQEPSGVDVTTANRWTKAAYQGSGNDGVVGLVGAIVSGTIARGQQTDFRERNARYFQAIERRMTGTLPEALQESILRISAPKLKPKPGESLRVRVQNFGLIRVGLNRHQEVLLAPAFRLQAQHLDSQRQVIQVWDINSPSVSKGHTMVDLVSQLGLLEAKVRHATANSVRQIR